MSHRPPPDLPDPDATTDPGRVFPEPEDPAEAELGPSMLGSGLLARLPTPEPDEAAVVAKVCPQCGAEYETGSRFCQNDGAPLRPKMGGDALIGRVIADRYLILAR